jgi:hypothetical protein
MAVQTRSKNHAHARTLVSNGRQSPQRHRLGPTMHAAPPCDSQDCLSCKPFYWPFEEETVKSARTRVALNQTLPSRGAILDWRSSYLRAT